MGKKVRTLWFNALIYNHYDWGSLWGSFLIKEKVHIYL